jgi:hypothetical protein
MGHIYHRFCPNSAVFYSPGQDPYNSCDDRRRNAVVPLRKKVPEGQNRMPVYHLRSGKSHHPADLLSHLRLVAVDRASAARRLVFSERTSLHPLFCVRTERPALPADRLSASVMAAAIDVDHFPYRLYFPIPVFHAFRPIPPLQSEMAARRRRITSIPFPCNSR